MHPYQKGRFYVNLNIIGGMSESDDALVQRAQRGNLEAMTTIYDTHYPAVFRYIHYRLRDQVCAEDLAVEVFVRMVEHIKSYKLRGKPILAWLYTIARNLVADYFYEQSRGNALLLEETLVDSNHLQPAQLIENQQEKECLEKAMLNLTEEQRQLIWLRFIEEYEVTEVAKIMGKNERAIRSLQHRALAALNRVLEDENCYGS